MDRALVIDVGVRLNRGSGPVTKLRSEMVHNEKDWRRYSEVDPLPGTAVQIGDLVGSFYPHEWSDEVCGIVAYRAEKPKSGNSVFTVRDARKLNFLDTQRFLQHKLHLCPLEDLPGRLTSRQIEIAKLIGEGLNQSEIAVRLCLHNSTIAEHVRALGKKLACGANADIATVRLAMMNSVVARTLNGKQSLDA